MPYRTLLLSLIIAPFCVILYVTDSPAWKWIALAYVGLIVIEAVMSIAKGRFKKDSETAIRLLKSIRFTNTTTAPKKLLTTQQKTQAVAWFIVALPFLWFFVVNPLLNGKSPAQKAEDEANRDNSIEACTCAQQRVETMLKAPSTAKFGSCHDAVVRLGGQRYAVASYVDSQNGFGAMLRTSFNCDVTVEDKMCVTQCAME